MVIVSLVLLSFIHNNFRRLTNQIAGAVCENIVLYDYISVTSLLPFVITYLPAADFIYYFVTGADYNY